MRSKGNLTCFIGWILLDWWRLRSQIRSPSILPGRFTRGFFDRIFIRGWASSWTKLMNFLYLHDKSMSPWVHGFGCRARRHSQGEDRKGAGKGRRDLDGGGSRALMMDRVSGTWFSGLEVTWGCSSRRWLYNYKILWVMGILWYHNMGVRFFSGYTVKNCTSIHRNCTATVMLVKICQICSLESNRFIGKLRDLPPIYMGIPTCKKQKKGYFQGVYHGWKKTSMTRHCRNLLLQFFLATLGWGLHHFWAASWTLRRWVWV